MPASLKVRFNGHTREIIEYTRVWGRFKAMERYGVADYVAFCKFLEGETGDPNFGINHKIDDSKRGDLAEDLLDAFTNKLLKVELEKRCLIEQLEAAKRELEYYKTVRTNQLEPKIQTVMGLCK